MTYKEEVGKRISIIRNNLKMTQREFAESLELSEVFIATIETGKRSLSIDTLTKIIKFTGISSDYILFGNDSDNSNIDKINRILKKFPDYIVDFIYKTLLLANSFFKNRK